MPRAFAPSRVEVVYSLTAMGNAARMCTPCGGEPFASTHIYAAHILTPQHREAVALLPGQQRHDKPRPVHRRRTYYSPATFCRDCKVQCRTAQAYAEHLAGRKHTATLDRKRAGERRAMFDNSTTSAPGKSRERVYRRQRKTRGRWQAVSEEAAMWRQTRRAEQAVLRRWWKRHRGKRVPECRERRETRRKRRLRRANARVGRARGWKQERGGEVALAHARPEGKPGAAPVKLKRRDEREVHICGACGVTYVKARAYHAHLQSAGHHDAAQCVARPASLPSWCAVCKVHLSLRVRRAPCRQNAPDERAARAERKCLGCYRAWRR